jgi:hypothetical protein
MNRNELLLEPRHLGVTIRCVKIISKPMVCLAQMVHQSCMDTNTISKWINTNIVTKRTKIRFHMTHAPSSSIECIQNDLWTRGTFKQNMRPSCTDTNTLSPNGPKCDSTWRTSPRSSSGAFKMISEPVVRSAQNMYLSCIKISTISKHTKMRFHLGPRHLGVSLDASKMISEPMVLLAKMMHLSCIDTNTIPK